MAITHSPSTKQDILQYLIKHGQGTAQDLADNLDISPQAIRRHLKDLEGEGLIEHQSIQTGMGRPQFIYHLSRQGRQQFPHRYREFAVSFLDTMVEIMGEQQVGELLRKQWQRKAAQYRQRIGQGSLKKRVAKLVQLRREEGYMAELHQVQDKISHQDKREKYILAEHNCAISEVAESYPTVCGHELEMFSEVLPDCLVERTHWINNGEHNCGYLIQAK